MPRGRRSSHVYDRLGGEGCSVLAVLVLAALWPERFPGGWVTVDVFGQAGLYLGERRSRESLKAAIRRGAARLRGEPVRARLEMRRTSAGDPATGRPLRERDRRLAAPPGDSLRVWVRRRGPDLIAPHLWRAFREPACDQLSQPPIDQNQLTAALRRAESLLVLALRGVAVGSAEWRRLSRLHRLLRAGLRLGIQLGHEA